MGISSSALASLVIAGTAIGGTTIAVIANTAQADLKSSNISQISTDTQTPILPGDQAASDQIPTVIVPNRIAMPVSPTPDSSLPKITPPAFNAGGDDDDDESEDSDDEGYEDSGEDD